MAYIPPHKRKQCSASTSSTSTEITNKVDADVFLDAFSRITCINLDCRPDKWKQVQSEFARLKGIQQEDRIRRCSAVDGRTADRGNRVVLEWDTTQNARWDHKIPSGQRRTLSDGEVGCALSHISLWEETAHASDPSFTMLILEDDATFFRGRRGSNNNKNNAHRFLRSFRTAWDHLPDDWGIFYLGFSDRGERNYVFNDAKVEVFRPSYGFHTHAYAITQKAASVLMDRLPVRGPLDVWIADNDWFGIPVYCAVVPNEGWKGSGAPLIYQDRRPGITSDIIQSGRGL